MLAVFILCGCNDPQKDDREGKNGETTTVSVDPSFTTKERLGKLLFLIRVSPLHRDSPALPAMHLK